MDKATLRKISDKPTSLWKMTGNFSSLNTIVCFPDNTFEYTKMNHVIVLTYALILWLLTTTD